MTDRPDKPGKPSRRGASKRPANPPSPKPLTCPSCAERDAVIRRLVERLRLQTLFVDSVHDLLDERGLLKSNPTLSELFRIFRSENELDRAIADSHQAPARPAPTTDSKIIDITAERRKRTGG